VSTLLVAAENARPDGLPHPSAGSLLAVAVDRVAFENPVLTKSAIVLA